MADKDVLYSHNKNGQLTYCFSYGTKFPYRTKNSSYSSRWYFEDTVPSEVQEQGQKAIQEHVKQAVEVLTERVEQRDLKFKKLLTHPDIVICTWHFDQEIMGRVVGDITYSERSGFMHTIRTWQVKWRVESPFTYEEQSELSVDAIDEEFGLTENGLNQLCKSVVFWYEANLKRQVYNTRYGLVRRLADDLNKKQ